MSAWNARPISPMTPQATVAEARRLWAAVDRPNLMVKVPGTPAGLPAIRQLIGAGININVTLLFSVDVYDQVAEAYIAALEDVPRQGGDIARIGSVASFFVSRIDTAVDKRLDALEDKGLAAGLRGRTAILNARTPTSATTTISRGRAGRRWRRRARAASACSGPPPASRIPPTATRAMSKG